MRTFKFALHSFLLGSLAAGTLAAAATVQGTVTDKTTNTPAAGDKVELVDVQAGMSVVGTATTDSKGRYKLNEPGNGPYLVRVTHQGGQYFIAAPQGDTPGDIPVFDVAAQVEGISIEADVMEMETDNGQLRVTERYFVHNTSQPPHTEYNPKKGFEIVLPADAVVDGAAAKRPTGLPTSIDLKPTGQKSHFEFDFPIQPDEGEKDTLFQVSYHLPYSGKMTFRPQELMRADNVAILLPKSINFTSDAGFQSVPQDPSVQTLLLKNVPAGKTLDFTISGTGSMPREQQGAQGQQGPEAGQAGQAAPGGQPGGGIGEPINTPDPLTKYKWWILGGLGLLLATAAGFLLRKPSPAAAGAVPVAPATLPTPRTPPGAPMTAGANVVSAKDHKSLLLTVLKEELFALESEKLSGTINQAEYLEQKAALETVLKRALKG